MFRAIVNFNKIPVLFRIVFRIQRLVIVFESKIIIQLEKLLLSNLFKPIPQRPRPFLILTENSIPYFRRNLLSVQVVNLFTTARINIFRPSVFIINHLVTETDDYSLNFHQSDENWKCKNPISIRISYANKVCPFVSHKKK